MSTTILVVDDDACMRELLRLHLTNAGYEVVMAEDAVVAGHSVARQRPDLILLDVEMPFMTGLEFVQALKADPTVSAIPVVFISSRDDCEDSAKELGARAFLRKPVLADHLLATVAGYVPEGRIAL